MIFDGHSDIFYRRNGSQIEGRNAGSEKSPSASFKKGQHRRRLLCSVD